MPPIKITRAEYEKKFGVKPVATSTSLLEDEVPAPIRITRSEWNALQQQWKPQQPQQQDGLGSQLVNRAKDVGDALVADKPSDLAPGRTAIRIGGALTGAESDVIGAALSPAFGKLTDMISNIPAVQKFAMKEGTSKALDVINEAVQITQDEWKQFEEKNPEVAQDIRDVTNIASFIPVGKGAQVAGKGVAKATEGIVPKVAKNLDERGVKNVVNEIAKIEDKYGQTRNANLYSKNVDASRQRIAESNVLDGAVDTDGVIRTKKPGGVIDQYKAQTIDGLEDVVRKGLIESKETIPTAMVRQALVREVGRSGLEGADLVTALKKIDKEMEGLNVRIKGSSIVDLRYLHDNKIATTKNINYLTPPEKSTYRKAIARAYKTLVEENSQKVDVKGINKELATYYDDIKRLERLDGARAEGGRLGKYTASMAGTLIGGAAGSAGGGIGAAVGGIVGGEAAAALKGLGMSRTFKGGGKGLPKSAVLEKARLSIPDKAIKARAGIPKTKEITKLEKDIAKNVTDQKKAIAKGDFALVAALKEVYTALVEELKKAIKYLNENASVGMAIKDVTKRKLSTEDAMRITDDLMEYDASPIIMAEKSKAVFGGINKTLDLGDNVNARLGELKEKNIEKSLTDAELHEADALLKKMGASSESPKVKPKKDTLDPTNYKSAEEFVKAQGNKTYYHTTSTDVAPLIEKDGFKAQVGERTMGTTQGNGVFFYEDVSPTVNFGKNFTWKGKEPTVVEAKINGKIYNSKSQSKSINALAEDTGLIEQLKADGFVGIRGTENGTPVTFVFEPSAVKTKSQLTDIYNKAHGKIKK